MRYKHIFLASCLVSAMIIAVPDCAEGRHKQCHS